MRNNNASLVALLGHLQGHERNETLIREVLDYSRRVRGQMSDLTLAFQQIDYPFDHAEGAVTVGSYLLKMLPPEEEVGAVYQAADDLLDSLVALYVRALGRLCLIAEAVESDLGFQPLPSAKPA
jgi:hypothetical protein